LSHDYQPYKNFSYSTYIRKEILKEMYYHRLCVSPADMSNFIRLGANQCGAGGVQGVWAPGFQGGDMVVGVPYTVLAMVDLNNAGVVDVPLAFPIAESPDQKAQKTGARLPRLGFPTSRDDMNLLFVRQIQKLVDFIAGEYNMSLFFLDVPGRYLKSY
jgi:hypothetical protein